MSPSGPSFPYLGSDCLDVIVILCEHPPEVFENLHQLQHVPMDRKLLPKGQSRRYRRLPLLFSLSPDRAFL